MAGRQRLGGIGGVVHVVVGIGVMVLLLLWLQPGAPQDVRTVEGLVVRTAIVTVDDDGSVEFRVEVAGTGTLTTSRELFDQISAGTRYRLDVGTVHTGPTSSDMIIAVGERLAPEAGDAGAVREAADRAAFYQQLGWVAWIAFMALLLLLLWALMR